MRIYEKITVLVVKLFSKGLYSFFVKTFIQNGTFSKNRKRVEICIDLEKRLRLSKALLYTLGKFSLHSKTKKLF